MQFSIKVILGMGNIEIFLEYFSLIVLNKSVGSIPTRIGRQSLQICDFNF